MNTKNILFIAFSFLLIALFLSVSYIVRQNLRADETYSDDCGADYANNPASCDGPTDTPIACGGAGQEGCVPGDCTTDPTASCEGGNPADDNNDQDNNDSPPNPLDDCLSSAGNDPQKKLDCYNQWGDPIADPGTGPYGGPLPQPDYEDAAEDNDPPSGWQPGQGGGNQPPSNGQGIGQSGSSWWQNILGIGGNSGSLRPGGIGSVGSGGSSIRPGGNPVSGSGSTSGGSGIKPGGGGTMPGSGGSSGGGANDPLDPVRDGHGGNTPPIQHRPIGDSNVEPPESDDAVPPNNVCPLAKTGVTGAIEKAVYTITTTARSIAATIAENVGARPDTVHSIKGEDDCYKAF